MNISALYNYRTCQAPSLFFYMYIHPLLTEHTLSCRKPSILQDSRFGQSFSHMDIHAFLLHLMPFPCHIHLSEDGAEIQALHIGKRFRSPLTFTFGSLIRIFYHCKYTTVINSKKPTNLTSVGFPYIADMQLLISLRTVALYALL